MPPSPVVVDVPAAVAARPSAVLAVADRAPKLMPAIVMGMSSSSGLLANRVPSTVVVSHFSRYPSSGYRVSEAVRNSSSSK
jgi:hypothetical protein